MSRTTIPKIIFACICLVGLTLPLWGQKTNEGARGILGYLDPRTGAFTPVSLVSDESPEAAAAITTCSAAPCAGQFVINFTITVKSAFPSTDTIACIVSITVLDGTGTLTPRSFNESASVAATGTGSTRTCKVTIPYSWTPLATPGSDVVVLADTIIVPFVSTTNALPNRSSNQTPFFTLKGVPANGAITTPPTINATI